MDWPQAFANSASSVSTAAVVIALLYFALR